MLWVGRLDSLVGKPRASVATVIDAQSNKETRLDIVQFEAVFPVKTEFGISMTAQVKKAVLK